MIKWFAANKLVLNLVEMNVMKFIAENSFHATLCIGCKETNVEEMFNTIFLGLKIDNHLNCKNHTEKMISK